MPKIHKYGALHLALIVVLGGFLLGNASAEVRIHELMAASTEHVITRLPDGTPRVGAGPAWFEETFDAGGWPSANAPFGFGVSGVSKNTGAEMLGVTPSLYLNKTFNVSSTDANRTEPLRLDIAYVDGFVAYLNGKEIVRKNMGGTHMPAYAGQWAFNQDTATGVQTYTLGNANNFLQAGDNVLAIQVHNNDVDDGQLFCRARMRIDLATDAILVNYTDSWNYFVGVGEPSGGFISDDPAAGHFTDFIELHNDGGSAVNLAGWSLSDAPSDLTKWTFPSVSIPAGGYLVVACSGLDKTDPANPLHTNFQMGGDGEAVTLTRPDGVVVSVPNPNFRVAGHQFSYGWNGTVWRYYEQITPGSANAGPNYAGVLKKPDFDLAPGFYGSGLAATMIPVEAGTTVRYTTDGSEPKTTSSVAAGPIPLTANVALRARSFKPDYIPSGTETRTYLINEPSARQGVRAVCLTADNEQSLFKPNGATAIVGGEYVNALWQSTGPDDYNMAIMRGRAHERPTSFEMVDPSDATNWIQQDMGLRIAGSNYTRPRYTLPNLLGGGVWNLNADTEKVSFNVYARGDYGADKLDFNWLSERPGRDTFERIRLRGGKNDWRNPFIVDETVRRLFHRMGHASAVGEITTLYVNGEYKAYYNTVERIDEEFLEDYYGDRYGTGADEWDIFNHNGVQEGDDIKYQEMMTYAFNNDLDVLANYQSLGGMLEMDNWIDYLLVNTHCGTEDWPHNNYYLSRERSPEAKWHFHVWDAEAAFGYWGEPITFNSFLDRLDVDTRNNPKLYRALRDSPEFKLRFADRIHKHLFNNGTLTEANIQATYDPLKSQAEPLIDNLHGLSFSQVMQTWIDGRRSHYLDHARAAGFWPTFLPPAFNVHGGQVAANFSLSISNPNSNGTIYYTTDGSDPRLPGGAIAPGAQTYNGSFALGDSALVVARAKNGSTWSACTEAEFILPAPQIVRITELMYHPPDAFGVLGEELEFIELKNVGNQSLNLANFAFTDGISYTFPQGSLMNPGDIWVIAANATSFALKYPGVPVHGEFSGKLSNGGERIALSDLTNNEWLVAAYDDSAPWSTLPDGMDFSLNLQDQGGAGPYTNAPQWFVACAGGSPGADAGGPVQAPSITDQPDDVASMAGGAATFSVSVAGCPTPDVFQWWKNGLPIAGANTASYTTPALVAGDHLAPFFVIASNPLGAVTSQVAVVTVNQGPSLAAIPNQTADEGSLFSFTPTATDPDTPANQLSFSLLDGPAGMQITPATGELNWTPGETDGGQTELVRIRVTDPISGEVDTESFNVSINEVNQAPTASGGANVQVVAGQAATATFTATDPDLPVQGLSWSLLPGAPAGASIDANGLLSFTTDPATPAGPVTIQVQVSDDGSPSLTDTANVTFDVIEPIVVTIRYNAQTKSNILTWNTEPNVQYRVDVTTDLEIGNWLFLSSGFAQQDTMSLQHPVPGAFPPRYIYRVSRQ